MAARKCVFRDPFIRENVDPRVAQIWLSTFGVKAPYGKLRQMWKTQHCTKVDPYNTGCPYRPEDCAMAFLVAVQRTAGAHPDRPTGYFRSVSLTMGLDRADNKPLARDIVERTDVHKEGDTRGLRRSPDPRHGSVVRLDARPGLESRRPGGVAQEPSPVSSASNRPVRVGELLRALDLGPRQRPTTDEQEGDK